MRRFTNGPKPGRPREVRWVLEQEYEVPMKLGIDLPRLRKSITRSNTDDAHSVTASSAVASVSSSPLATDCTVENDVDTSEDVLVASDSDKTLEFPIGTDSDGEEEDEDNLDGSLCGVAGHVGDMEQFLKQASLSRVYQTGE